MSTMIERVARAIWNIRREEEDRCDIELEDMCKDHSVWAEARAAIAAMREPTEGMEKEMGGLITGEVEDYNVYLGRDDARTAWQLGIDAALEEKP